MSVVFEFQPPTPPARDELPKSADRDGGRERALWRPNVRKKRESTPRPLRVDGDEYQGAKASRSDISARHQKLRQHVPTMPLSLSRALDAASTKGRLLMHSLAQSSPTTSPRARTLLHADSLTQRRRFPEGRNGSRDVSYKSDRVGHGILPSPRRRPQIAGRGFEEKGTAA